ncbi:HK97 gp10 family phage protein [Pelagibacterium sp. 26DY04]|uniref:HK97-gp10 family putative phage morphogenesis protein n=1 Tax=Pelagibacterium sp. 26DY04 TaxID=2967130 RepID=UPI002815E4D1|nr:HK97-gp10 family putative phage morphogenesis protein [Pelagibacterium sp. 26DY04]WMT88657.1 HK97 gp10 family phage protein [Pelagibacterium sp. 26DY04]
MEARFRALPDEVQKDTEAAAVRAAGRTADHMRRLAERSRDTGALVESITVTPAGGSTPSYSAGGAYVVPPGAAAVTAGNTNARHAHFVEFGTHDAPAQPFFFPAVRSNRKPAARAIKAAGRRAIKKAMKK